MRKGHGEYLGRAIDSHMWTVLVHHICQHLFSNVSSIVRGEMLDKFEIRVLADIRRCITNPTKKGTTHEE